MSNGAIACLMAGGFGSLYSLISWRTDKELIRQSMFGWRERFFRVTWPVWPVLLVVGVVLWVKG